jgi:lysophospholipase L1-like esterase
MAVAGFVTAGALPAAAAPGTVDYVALGDSYAAGVGAGSYDGTSCMRSDNGYPALLDRQSVRIETANVACSGATIDGVRDQLELPALETDPQLVTLTVGANNLRLFAVLTACLPGPSPQCDLAISNAQAMLGDCPGVSPLGGNLTDLYGAVAETAPSARIVVTGYPLLFESPAPGTTEAKVNKATIDLNCVIERAVAAANAADINIHYVDVTEEFAGHGIGCTPSPDCLFINPPAVGLPEAFHPNAEGYNAYADAIKTKLPGGWFDKSSV